KEKLYQKALLEKLRGERLSCQQEVGINIRSEDSGEILENHRLDIVVENKVIIECKALKFIPQKLENQLYSYLKNSKWEVGLLVNFGSTNLYLKRIILTNDRKSH
ncbi:MAG: GxxExxY protein, partial [Candidatus Helarchaeota archaeon]